MKVGDSSDHWGTHLRTIGKSFSSSSAEREIIWGSMALVGYAKFGTVLEHSNMEY